MNPTEIYERLKLKYPNIGYDLEYKGKEPHVNIYNSHRNTKYPLLVFHYVEDYEHDDEIVYQKEFELFNFTDMWMCRELETTLPIRFNMEYDEFCFKVNEIVIGGYTYPCAHTETFTPDDNESIWEALDNCRVYALERFHILSHKLDCFLDCHHEFEELVKDNDRIVLRQLLTVLSYLKA